MIQNHANAHLYFLFFGALLLIGLYYWSALRKAARIAAFAHVDSMNKIADRLSKPKQLIKRILMVCAYLLLIYSIMRPQGAAQPQGDSKEQENAAIESKLSLEDMQKDAEDGNKVKVRDSARDVIFLLDVSGSMGVEDLYPNRLQKAKDMISDMLTVMKSEHVALVIFTSVPSVKCVLTLDHTYFKDVLSSVVINDNDFKGTRFTPALTEIIERQFDFSDNKYKELIVITDGGDTQAEGLSGESKKQFEQSIYDLAKKGFDEKKIRIHTVGLGTRGGAIIKDESGAILKDENGQPVRSSLNEAFLQNISKNSQGVYVPAADSNINMEEIYQNKIAVERQDMIKEKEIEVNKDSLKELVQKQKSKEEQKILYQEFYFYPLFFVILLLIIEFSLNTRKTVRKESGQ